MEVFICIYIDMNALLAGDVADEGGVQTCAAVEDDIALFRDGDFACVQIFSVDNGIFVCNREARVDGIVVTCGAFSVEGDFQRTK